MSRLSILLLGSFQVYLDGVPVDGFESDKVRALLAYLAVEAERPFRRELLTGLLWPDMPESQARVNLRRALKNLRDAIGDRQATPSFLCISRTAIQFNPVGHHQLDTTTFLQKLHYPGGPDKITSLQEASTIYQGDFLAGFSIGDSAAFEEWLLLKREQLCRLAWETHHTLAKHEAQHGRFPSALHHAQRQIELEPLQEASHRRVMRYLTFTRRHNEALAHYRTLRHTLQTELNVTPDAKTRRLYESIRDGALRLPAETAVPHNLPPQPTPFVGRDSELNTLDALIAAPDNRLITIHGVGGTGKTRLALAAAQRQTTVLIEQNNALTFRFPDGVYFVRLAPLQTPDRILPTLAEVLDFRLQRSEQETRTTQQQLLDYLRQKRLLLIMDNFEHLLDGSKLLTDILQTAPTVQILVTSRERLRLRWEQVFPIAGLTYPTERDSTSSLTAYTAVQMFQQTANRLRPGFQPSPKDKELLKTICRLVEGMPLALELAASWVETHPLPAIADLIQQGLGALQTDYRDVPARHRSITAVFDASWQQLTNEEQQALSRMSVFRNPFTVQAAGDVADATNLVLSRLLHKSLLQFDRRNGRYQLHQLLRQYANGYLAQDAAVATETKNRHSAYHLDLMAEISPELIGKTQKAAFSQIEAAAEDVQAAWQWAVANKDDDRLCRSVDALGRFYERFTRLEEGILAMETAVDQLQHNTTPKTIHPLLRCRTWLGRFYFMQDETGAAKEQYTICRQLLNQPAFAREDLREEKARLNRRFGWLLLITGSRQKAKQSFTISLKLSQSVHDKWGEVAALGGLAAAQTGSGSYAKKYELYKESEVIYRELGDFARLAYTLEDLGQSALFQGFFKEAEQYTAESVLFHKAVDNRLGIASGTFQKAVPLFWQGYYFEANELVKESLTLYQELGVDEKLEFSFCTNYTHLGEYDLALDYAQKGEITYRKQQYMRNWGLCLAVQGWIALARLEYRKATQFLEKAAKIYMDIKLQSEIGWILFPQALVVRGLQQTNLARQFAYETAVSAAATRDFSIATCALEAAAVLLCDKSALEDKIKGIELHALALNYGWISNSKWFADIAGCHVTAVTDTLPPEIAHQAQERGAAQELWETIDALSMELSARGWHELNQDETAL